MSNAPIVYLLHGGDTHAMRRFIAQMIEKMGDPAMAEMNTSHLDGNYDFDQLVNAASAAPFLAARRLVVAHNLSKKFDNDQARDRLTRFMDGLPLSTALVAFEEATLKKTNWLHKWADKAGGRAFVKAFNVPEGAALADWIRAYAKAQGGEITPAAAALLAEIGVEGTGAAALEVDKLLAYVNYSRAVEQEDVDLLAAFATGGGDFFKFIDAIGAGNARGAMDMLHRLYDEQPPLMLFFSLVGQFRALLQAREVVEGGGREGEVAERLKMHPYRAGKVATQARTMSLASLEAIYRRLLEDDVRIKTGQITPELALETLVAELTL
jgi:DNA polymerase-3 subunit delta